MIRKKSKLRKDAEGLVKKMTKKGCIHVPLLESLYQIVERSDFMVVLTDDKDNIYYANEMLLKFLGFKRRSVLGKNIKVLGKGNSFFSREMYPQIFESISNKQVWNGEVPLQGEDGNYHYRNILVAPVNRIGGEEFHFSVKENSTDYKDVVKELQLLNRELESFAHTVSHDLKSPLCRVGWNTDILKSLLKGLGIDNNEEISSRIASMETNIADAMSLVDQFLRLATVGKGDVNMIKFSLSRMTKEVANSLVETKEIYKRAQIIIDSNMEAYGDVHFMRIVMSNLISNALKYSSKEKQPVIHIGACSKIKFFVEDNGVGIPKDKSHLAFVAFQRLHNDKEFKGNGVGLATVKRIITRHGGQVSVESEAGEGATFMFTLPAGIYKL